jgi:hypothetical protein
MVLTPKCPDCGRVPELVLDDGHQAFCPTADCRVITWDTHLTAGENRANTTEVDLSVLDPGPAELDMTDRAGFPSGPLFYDRAGKPLDTREWARLFEDSAYARVAISALHGYVVSTLWCGVHMGAANGSPPLIFETVVLDEATGMPTDMLVLERYATEDEALAGHRAIAQRIEHGGNLE